jgi:hypothetical protein
LNVEKEKIFPKNGISNNRGILRVAHPTTTALQFFSLNDSCVQQFCGLDVALLDYIAEKMNLNIRCQFHQQSTPSFCTKSLAPVKNKQKCKHKKAALATFVHKSCVYNVGEIDPRSQFHQHFTYGFFVLKSCALHISTYTVYLYFFWRKNIGTKTARKMLVKWTIGNDHSFS